MRDEVAGQRIARHGFVDRPARSPAEAAWLTCGLQAQDAQAARLGVRSRSTGVTEADVRCALDVERTVVKTWLHRGTIHLVAAEDVRWLTALFGPMIARKFAKRWRDLGLPPEVLERTAALLPSVLGGSGEGGGLAKTRPEIVADLAERGVAIDPQGQASTHMLLHATTEGLICRGPDRGRDATFVLLDDWLPPSPAGPSGDDALAELARRFFGAFSPATAGDFTAWSGLPSARAIALIRDELTPVQVYGRPGFRLGETEPRQGLRLLSAFDNYLVGYRDRDAIVDLARRTEVYDGGIIRPTVLHDGRVVGRWQLTRTARSATVAVHPLEPLSRRVRDALDREIADVGRFIGLPAALDLR